MGQALELARFKVRPGAETTLVATRRQAIEALRRSCDGFVSGSFVRLGHDEWLDAIVWESRTHAEAAAAKAPTIEECAAYFGAITEIVAMEHGDIADVD